MNHDHHDHNHGKMEMGKMPAMDMDMTQANGSMPHMMMSMFFHFGMKEVILFDFWRISSILELIGSMVGIFFLAALYEGLKVFREFLQQRDMAAQLAAAAPNSNKTQTGRCAPFSLGHLVQTLLHMIQITLSYFLMLIAMTYNVWLFAAVVVGAGVGYFAFGWRRRITVSDSFEHCH